jgi:hypothetical protein
VIRRLVPLAALTAFLALPSAGAAQASGQAPRRPIGFTVSADLGGGGQLGAGSAYQPSSLFELEATAGYYFGLGLSPEFSLGLGMSPGTYFIMRPGLHWAIPETPFYLRGALDVSTQSGPFLLRWILLGAGVELRFTDVAGFYAEGDSGIPLSAGAGVPMLVRAGAFFSF